jgi:uncharacterized repeat protein (TIGR01451 family)
MSMVTALRIAFCLLLGFGLVAAQAQVCAPPASLGTTPSSGIVNNYYAGNGNLAATNVSLTLGALDGRGASSAVAVGDLLMVMQMQDASINTSNTTNYGGNAGTSAGSTSVGRSGLFEFVRVTSVAGPVIGFTPALANSYEQLAATATNSQKSYQVIKVAQYASLTANGITAPAWNGATGGVTAVDVQDALTLGSGTVEGVANRAFFLAGKGFRGGAGRQLGGSGGAFTDVVTLSTAGNNASKAEGIAGTPFDVATLTSNWGFKTTNPPAITRPTGPATIEGYVNGSYAAGAPANAGGGGTDGNAANSENAGGGGGGNYGPGGVGGRPWNSPLRDTGGRGGAGYAGTLAFNRVFMGGGGGAGGTNNGTNDTAAYPNNGMGCSLTAGLCSSGAAGGGVVIIRARSITGSGVIDVNGAHGYNVQNDAGGGGGAAGSVILQTQNGGSATVDAKGGDGGNAWGADGGGAGNRHGPGGAGGGGFIAYSPSSFGLTAAVDGGQPGITLSGANRENYGSEGFNGGIANFQTPNVPGSPPAALCVASLSLSKDDGQTQLISPSSNVYTFTVANNGLIASSGPLSVADKLPTGLTVTPGVLALAGANAADWTCNASNATDIYCTSSAPIAGGGSSVFAFSVDVLAVDGTGVTNRARVAGGGDPAKPQPGSAAAGVAAAAACTANNVPEGCALDTDTVQAPNLQLTKTDGVINVLQGGTSTYTLAVNNTGAAPTSGLIRIVDVLPAGLVFSGSSPFTVNLFTCTVTAPNIVCDRPAVSPLAANAMASVTFTVSVSQSAPSSVLNLAQVGGGGDPTPAKSALPTPATAAACPAPILPATTSFDTNTGCAADVNQVSYVRLQLSKDDSTFSVNSGASTTYVFVISNIGTAASVGTINFRDVLPGTMNMPGALATPFVPTGVNGANWICIRMTSTDISCTSNVAIAAGGNSSFSLAVDVGATANLVQLTNRSRIGGGGDARLGMVTAPTVADVNACTTDGSPLGCAIDLNTVIAPVVRMTKSHPNPQARAVGSTFTFTLQLRNTGNLLAAANTVRMVDVVPNGLMIGSVGINAPFTCVTALQVITCDNTGGALNAGANIAITVNVTVASTATNPLINRGRIAGTGDPSNSVLPTAGDAGACTGLNAPSVGCATDLVPLIADLQVTKLQRLGTTGTFAAPLIGVPRGGTAQYQITVSNNGAGNATGITVSDTVPAQFSTVTWVCTAVGAASCNTASGSGNTVTLNVSVNSGTGNSVTLIVTAVAATATGMSGVTNTAVLTLPASMTDTVASNNSSSIATAIGVTSLSITKSNAVNTLTAGQQTTYTIVVTNSGPTAADGARLYDPVAPGLSCVTAPVCVSTGPVGSCPPGLSMAQLQNNVPPNGVALPLLGAGVVTTVTMVCAVTATGL